MKQAGWTAFGALAFLGLVLFVWTAISAPVVLWSDSTLDLEWPRQGIGINQEAPQGGHPAKPA